MAVFQKRSQTIFSMVHSEGAILPLDLLQRISDPQNAQLDGLTPEAYHLSTSKLNEAMNRAWTSLLGAWARFKNERAKLSAYESGTTLTRERWLLPLFSELGYERLQTKPALVVGERSYAISHGWEQTPIHLVSFRLELDRNLPSKTGTRRSSPHSLVQELLNRSNAHLWAARGGCLPLCPSFRPGRRWKRWFLNLLPGLGGSIQFLTLRTCASVSDAARGTVNTCRTFCWLLVSSIG